MLGLDVLGTGARVTHDVAHDDREPHVHDDEQPVEHQVDLLQSSFVLRGQYGFSDALAIDLALPIGVNAIDAEFTGASGELLPGFESIHHRDETIAGVGDMEIALRWAALALEGGPSLELRVGVALPFGDVVEDPYALGRAGRTHRHNFLGSGTVDPLIGAELGWSFESFDLSGWSSARIPLYVGPTGHRASRAISGGAAIGSAFGSEAWRFQAGPEVRWESTAEWGGRTAENSGRFDLMIGAAAFWSWDTGGQLFASLKAPLFVEAVGSQVTQPLFVALGLRWAVDL